MTTTDPQQMSVTDPGTGGVQGTTVQTGEEVRSRLSGRPIEILLVEDSPSDVRLTQEALRRAKVNNRLTVARDGIEALASLRQEGEHSNAPRPDLILLDLNLPKKNGRDVLAEIKGDENLKRIPVVILTTSHAEQDILRSYDLHANCYITKPVDLHQFIGVIQSIEGFWLTVVRLPDATAKP
jgi:two-component system, chemotaxis family, response regulator Rcp1